MKVIITGGASGIGLAISERLLEQGHKVLICYHTAEENAEKLTQKYNNALAFRADVSVSAQLDALFAFAKETLGDIDALINNAGVSVTDCFQCVAEEAYERVMNTNFGAVYKACARAVPSMLERKSGNIINISSIWGVRGASTEALYSASKAAVIAFTQALAAELGPSGIRVNCIAPGVIDTKMNAHLNAPEKQALVASTPLGRLGTGKDIAGAVSFLLSEDAAFITGQTLIVDGGFLNG